MANSSFQKSSISTPVSVANGGTGQTSLTAHNVLTGNGTSGINSVAPSTSGNVLTSNGTDWTSAAPAGGGGWAFKSYTSTTSNSFTISGLDLDTDKAYMMVIKFAGASSGNNIQFQVNGDTGSNNYYRYILNVTAGTGSGSAGWFAGVASNFQEAQVKAYITKFSGASTLIHSTALVSTSSATYQPDQEVVLNQYSQTTNLTSIKITSGNASDVFQVWIFKASTS